MNWFLIGAGLLYLGASAYELWRGNIPLAVVFECYAVANFALLFVKA